MPPTHLLLSQGKTTDIDRRHGDPDQGEKRGTCGAEVSAGVAGGGRQTRPPVF